MLKSNEEFIHPATLKLTMRLLEKGELSYVSLLVALLVFSSAAPAFAEVPSSPLWTIPDLTFFAEPSKPFSKTVMVGVKNEDLTSLEAKFNVLSSFPLARYVRVEPELLTVPPKREGHFTVTYQIPAQPINTRLYGQFYAESTPVDSQRKTIRSHLPIDFVQFGRIQVTRFILGTNSSLYDVGEIVEIRGNLEFTDKRSASLHHTVELVLTGSYLDILMDGHGEMWSVLVALVHLPPSEESESTRAFKYLWRVPRRVEIGGGVAYPLNSTLDGGFHLAARLLAFSSNPSPTSAEFYEGPGSFASTALLIGSIGEVDTIIKTVEARLEGLDSSLILIRDIRQIASEIGLGNFSQTQYEVTIERSIEVIRSSVQDARRSYEEGRWDSANQQARLANVDIEDLAPFISSTLQQGASAVFEPLKQRFKEQQARSRDLEEKTKLTIPFLTSVEEAKPLLTSALLDIEEAGAKFQRAALKIQLKEVDEAALLLSEAYEMLQQAQLSLDIYESRLSQLADLRLVAVTAAAAVSAAVIIAIFELKRKRHNTYLKEIRSPQPH